MPHPLHPATRRPLLAFTAALAAAGLLSLPVVASHPHASTSLSSAGGSSNADTPAPDVAAGDPSEAVEVTTTTEQATSTTSTAHTAGIDQPDTPGDEPSQTTTTVAPDKLITTFALPRKQTSAGAITPGFDNDLWFTQNYTNSTLGRTAIDRITVGGEITEYLLPNQWAGITDITRGPDGAFWFTEASTDKIGRITQSGAITEFSTGYLALTNITAGPDGALWFTGNETAQFASQGYVGRITPRGDVTIYPLDTFPHDIVTGPDGKLWLIGFSGIARMTTDGAVEDMHVATGIVQPGFAALARGFGNTMMFGVVNSGRQDSFGTISTTGKTTLEQLYPEINTGGNINALTAGPDGNVWMAWWNLSAIQRRLPDGTRTSYKVDRPIDITTGPDGNVWFTSQGGFVGRLNPTVADAG